MKKVFKKKKLVTMLMSIAILSCMATAVFAGPIPVLNPCHLHPDATYKVTYIGKCNYCNARAYLYRCGTCEIYGQYKDIACCDNGHLN